MNGDGTQKCDGCEWDRGTQGCDRCEWDRGTQGKNKIPLGRVLSSLHDSDVCDLWRQHYSTLKHRHSGFSQPLSGGDYGPGLLEKDVEAGLREGRVVCEPGLGPCAFSSRRQLAHIQPHIYRRAIQKHYPTFMHLKLVSHPTTFPACS